MMPILRDVTKVRHAPHNVRLTVQIWTDGQIRIAVKYGTDQSIIVVGNGHNTDMMRELAAYAGRAMNKDIPALYDCAEREACDECEYCDVCGGPAHEANCPECTACNGRGDCDNCR